MRTTMLALTTAVGLLAIGLAHCSSGSLVATSGADGGGGGGEGGTPPGPPPTSLGEPAEHRPTADACPSARPAGFNDPDAGAGVPEGGVDQCARDSDCTQGKNGRCLPQSRINAHFCSYDACSTDSECSSDKVCECGKVYVPTRAGNACLPGNCHTDGDCGAGGYCSPSLDKSCGSYIGVVGYYCHTPNDECTRDDQCSGGFCAFDPTVSKWACQHSVCAG